MAKKNVMSMLKKETTEKKGKATEVGIVIKSAKVDGKNVVSLPNLDELPAKVKKAFKKYEGAELTKEVKDKLAELMTKHDLKQVKTGRTKSSKSEKASQPKGKKPTPPKFEPRVFEGVTTNPKTGEEENWKEAHPNTRALGNYALLITTVEKGKGKKKKVETKYSLCQIIYEGVNTVWVLDTETEDAFAIRPEMLKAKRIWPFDEEGNYTDEQKKETVAELILVKSMQAESKLA